MSHLMFQPELNKGFMLIEVILAIALMSIGVIPLISLQGSLINKVWQQTIYVDHLFKLRNLFFMPEMQKILASGYSQSRLIEQKDIHDFTKIKYECVPLDNKSSLAGDFSDLYLLRASGSWHDANNDYVESLVSFVYIPPAIEQKDGDPKKEV